MIVSFFFTLLGYFSSTQKINGVSASSSSVWEQMAVKVLAGMMQDKRLLKLVPLYLTAALDEQKEEVAALCLLGDLTIHRRGTSKGE